MKLELKHIIPYLPYGLNVMFDNKLIGILSGIRPNLLTELIVMEELDNDTPIYKNWCLDDTKPILKPLSDLKDNKDFIRKFGGDNPNNLRMCNLDIDDLINNGLEFETYYGYYEWLIENHFDVLRLIDTGLAIDINTLNK
jgi:hypothetical protein